MTLNDFSNICMSVNNTDTLIYVTNTEPDQKADLHHTDPEEILKDLDLICVLGGNYEAKYYLQPCIANAEINNILALDQNKFLIYINLDFNKIQ